MFGKRFKPLDFQSGHSGVRIPYTVLIMKIKTVQGKRVTFIRYGGLSAVRQKGFGKDSYHAPPTRKGFYAFVWPYIETFLLSGYTENQNKVRKQNSEEGIWKLHHPRKFDYTGMLWHHLDTKFAIRAKGSWVLTSYDDYCEALDTELHKLKKASLDKGVIIRSGNTGYFSKDHLEVFIPANDRVI